MSNLVLQPVREGRTHGSVFLLVSRSEPPDHPPTRPLPLASLRRCTRCSDALGEGSQTLGTALEVGLEGLLSSSDLPVQVEVKVKTRLRAHCASH